MILLYYKKKENSTIFSKNLQINLKLFVNIYYKPVGNLGIKIELNDKKRQFCRLTPVFSCTIYCTPYFTPKYF